MDETMAVLKDNLTVAHLVGNLAVCLAASLAVKWVDERVVYLVDLKAESMDER